MDRDTRRGRTWCSEERPDAHPSSPGTELLHRSKCTQAIPSVCLSPALNVSKIISPKKTKKKKQINWKATILSCKNVKNLYQNKIKSYRCLDLRGWREEGAPTQTYPDQREKSWSSSYTCLPPGPPVKWFWPVLTKETDSRKETYKQEGEMSKPLSFFYHSSQPTFFIIIIIRLIVYMFSIKSMQIFFNSTFLCSL